MPALYRCRATKSEIARIFRCEVGQDLRWRSAYWPGENALVILLDDNRRRARLMHWGMPGPRSRRGTLRWAEPNFRARLAFQDQSDPPGRCLIPMECFALPEGRPRRRTRSWFGPWDEQICAWAGFWREVRGLGACFIGATQPANAVVRRVGRVMPVILRQEEQELWLTGTPAELRELWRRPAPDHSLWLERTDELWSTGQSLTNWRAHLRSSAAPRKWKARGQA